MTAIITVVMITRIHHRTLSPLRILSKLSCMILLGILFLAITPTVSAAVVINEIMPKPSDEVSEWVELYNTGPSAVPLTGWRLVSESGNTTYQFPPESTLEPASFLLLFQYQTNLIFHNEGDTVTLYDASGAQVDSQSFPSTLGYNTAMGRASDPAGSWNFCSSMTAGELNDCPVPTPTSTPLPTPPPTNTERPTRTPTPRVIAQATGKDQEDTPVTTTVQTLPDTTDSLQEQFMWYDNYRKAWIIGITAGALIVIFLFTYGVYTWEKNRH